MMRMHVSLFCFTLFYFFLMYSKATVPGYGNKHGTCLLSKGMWRVMLQHVSRIRDGAECDWAQCSRHYRAIRDRVSESIFMHIQSNSQAKEAPHGLQLLFC